MTRMPAISSEFIICRHMFRIQQRPGLVLVCCGGGAAGGFSGSRSRVGGFGGAVLFSGYGRGRWVQLLLVGGFGGCAAHCGGGAGLERFGVLVVRGGRLGGFCVECFEKGESVDKRHWKGVDRFQFVWTIKGVV